MLNRLLLVGLFGLLWVPSLSAAEPQFLSLPFLDETVTLQQGPLYADDLERHLGAGFAIDYIRGEVDNSETWLSFDVAAAAGGVAIRSFQNGYGHFVLIRHDVSDSEGRPFFTLYAHLEANSIPGMIPVRSRYDTQFEQWQPVEAGQFIGRAGQSGLGVCSSANCIHLHFEVFRGGYFQAPIDPYDISDETQQFTRDSYPPFAFPGCGSNSLWLECPPTVPESPAPPLEEVPTFNFALGFLGVDGNILASGDVDDVFDFFDGFNDGSLGEFPTSEFDFLGTVEESGGFLRLRSADGALATSRFGSAFLEDDAFLDHPLIDGGGDSEILVSFRADVPDTGKFYGIGIVNSGASLLESVFVGVGRGSDGITRVFVNDHTGAINASDPVDLSSASFILLELFVDDSTDEVVASYSVDNGITFKRDDIDFVFFDRHGTIFTATSDAFIFAQGGVRTSGGTAPSADDVVSPGDSGGIPPALAAALAEVGFPGGPVAFFKELTVDGDIGDSDILVADLGGDDADTTLADLIFTLLSDPNFGTPILDPGDGSAASIMSVSDTFGSTDTIWWIATEADIAGFGIVPDATWTYRVTDEDGLSDDAAVLITVEEPPPPSTLTITADRTLVNEGDSTTITWSATGVDSCVVTGPSGFFFTGLSGSESTGPILGQSIYTLICETAAGPVGDSVIVNIVPIFEPF